MKINNLKMKSEYDLKRHQELQTGKEQFKEFLQATRTSHTSSIANRTKIRVAVASKGGGLVNQHFGHAKEFEIYEVDCEQARCIDRRLVTPYCQGGYGEAEVLDNIIQTLSDCQAVLVSKIGNCPKEQLQAKGIECVEAYDVIENVVLDFYEQYQMV
ncbi:MAG: NifB/NifX family molybdenum-iron cluster-binding protein [Coleofasciculus sp. G3-WIS-01]|uniref:NifB/NifX family molybdenum-iron cluster-binding protein n=1 Tax=Coleofasciculus sp. G3-WIS-01 TaxID=3069528 RepID=UPI0032FE6FFD